MNEKIAMSATTNALKLFYCYAHEDKPLRDELDIHLSNMKRQQYLVTWHDQEISPGMEWEQAVSTQLNSADIILLLISPHFMASDCYDNEMMQALDRHKAGTTRLIPIILRTVDWEDAPFAKLQVLPTQKVPVTRWQDRDEAWNDVVRGIRRATEELMISRRNFENQSILNVPSNTILPSEVLQNQTMDEGQPTVERPMLICLAVDVSGSMKQPIIDHTGKTISRWISVRDAIEEFVHQGVSWVKDPETQKVLPLYHFMAYGFGFREVMHAIGLRKKPGGAVRDLLAHPRLPSLPSTSELEKYWADYKNNLLSRKEYTGDLFGSTPMCQALTIIRDRIREEHKKKAFTTPTLLLIISDGLSDDGDDPLPIIKELHAMKVMTLSCYLASRDVLASQRLYKKEEKYWSDGAKQMFRCASPLYLDNYVTRAMFDYLSDLGWKPQEGERLFGQVNQAEGLEHFLKILLSGSVNERRA